MKGRAPCILCSGFLLYPGPGPAVRHEMEGTGEGPVMMKSRETGGAVWGRRCMQITEYCTGR